MHARIVCAVLLPVLLIVVLPATARAQATIPAPGVSAYPPENTELIPSTVESYASLQAASKRLEEEVSFVPKSWREEVLTRPRHTLRLGAEPSTPPGRRKYLPVLLSALVPGAGELYLGYTVRGAALMAVEAGAWVGYFHYHGKGLDSREEYENFADKHWTISKWINDHPEVYPNVAGYSTPEEMDEIGEVVSGTGSWPGYIPWVSKEEDKQHFYENIGKYDWYISGWEDFDPALDPFPRDTALRDEYRSMRKRSNDQLDDANVFIYGSLVVRVFSIVQTILLTRGGDEQDDVSLTKNQLRFRARPVGFGGGVVALEYSFK